MVTKEQAMAAGERQAEFHYGPCKVFVGPRGGRKEKIEVWRTNGACQTWKTRPEEFRLPIKYGFSGPYHAITNHNAAEFHLASECQPVLIRTTSAETAKKRADRPQIRCDQCQMLSINGVPCHETGCPNSKKTWVPHRGEWLRLVECRNCGAEFFENDTHECDPA